MRSPILPFPTKRANRAMLRSRRSATRPGLRPDTGSCAASCGHIRQGSKVSRYHQPKIGALNLVHRGALGGGVTRALTLDVYSKGLSSAILDLGPVRA